MARSRKAEAVVGELAAPPVHGPTRSTAGPVTPLERLRRALALSAAVSEAEILSEAATRLEVLLEEDRKRSVRGARGWI